MKKLIAIALCVIALIPFVACSFEKVDMAIYQSGEYTYKLNEDQSASIIYCELSERVNELEVPDMLGEYCVKSIESNAFDCSKIESITLPENIETIKENAFLNCDNVFFLSVPSQINCTNGFQNLNQLKTLQITYGLDGFMNDYIDADSRFYNDSAATIETLIINNGVRYLSDYAFSNFTSLTSISISANVESLGEYCFYNSALSDLSFTSSLTSLSRYCLYNEEQLSSPTILLPQSITYMGQNCLSPYANYICYLNSRAYVYLNNLQFNCQTIDMEFTNSRETLQLGESLQLKMRDVQWIEDTIAFTSNNQKIAVVDEEGVVRAYGTGTAIITAKSRSGSSTVEINVEYNEKTGKQTYYKLIGVGEQFRIDASQLFENGSSNKKTTYRSLNEDIVNVDDSGLVTGAEIGEGVIEISSGNNLVQYVFEVNRLITSLSIEDNYIDLNKGDSVEMNVSIYPGNASNNQLSYKSSDATIAIVDDCGTITALKNGACMITASANDGSCCEVEMRVNVSSSLINIEHVSRIQIPGKSYQIYATSQDGDSLIYSSTNPAVASVDENGRISAHMEGTSTINIHTANNSAFTSFEIRVCDGFSFGIDISQWNGLYNTVDTFKAIKEDGVDFVYIRFAYGDDSADRVYERNYKYAKEAGLDVGAYHYIISTTVEDAIKEAQFMLTLLEGKQFEYPIAIDMEDEDQKSLDNDTFNRILKVYTTILNDAGYCTVVYSSASMLNKTDGRLEYWMAHWGPLYPNYYRGSYNIWQYTSKGWINGLHSNVDLDVCFYNYPAYIKSHHLNGY